MGHPLCPWGTGKERQSPTDIFNFNQCPALKLILTGCPVAKGTVARLVDAFDGKTYPSESDANFQVFGDVKELTLDEFFGDLVEDPEYAKLKATIEKELTDVKVLQYGHVTVQYLIAGKCPKGNTVLISTSAVET